MEYIAHIRSSDGQIQTIEEHLQEVKGLAEGYGKSLGVSHIAGVAGLLHDLGKYSEEFQVYLIDAVNHPEAPPKRGSVDHSTAGGRLLYHRYHMGKIDRYKGILAEIVGNAIISHHSYLHDYLNPELESDYLYRVAEKEIKHQKTCERLFFERIMSEQDFDLYVEQAAKELEHYLATASSFTWEQKCMYLTKFIFSTLIDGDRTNTRMFEESSAAAPPLDHQALFSSYYEKLMDEIDSYAAHPQSTSLIHQLRRKMSDQCDQFADRPSGVYTLSIPTGGGKTLASLRYALKHAMKYGKEHIIYVLPYTTIIEQNAAEVRRILQDDIHILEHHSNVIEEPEDEENNEMEEGTPNVREKLRLAKDDWDAPIIFTTMVQFLNVFYAKGSRNIRRLHNLGESVIIFDEVQKVPVSCVSLFNEALNFLSGYCQSSLVLCTATQPALDFVEHRLQLSPNSEMIANLDDVVTAFKRVDIIDTTLDSTFNNERLTEFVMDKLDSRPSILIILNTKSVVRNLYERLLEQELDTPIFHLSTSMCAAHRKDILRKIRDRLRKKLPVICISTPLIEAGVDVSFECVIRSLAGLDSIAQAAGRCNRHGEYGLREVYVIDHSEENLRYLKEISNGKKIAGRLFTDLQNEPCRLGGHALSVSMMNQYFRQFYSDVKASLNYTIKGSTVPMTKLLSAAPEENTYLQNYCAVKRERPKLFLLNSYRTAAKHFQVINNLTTSVIVPYGDEGKELIAELLSAERIEDFGRLMRRAQQFTINLFRYERDELQKNAGIRSCLDGQVLVLTDSAYNSEYGLDLKNDSWMENYQF